MDMKKYLVKYIAVDRFAPVETVVKAKDVIEAEELLLAATKYQGSVRIQSICEIY